MTRSKDIRISTTWFGAVVLFEALYPEERVRERLFEESIILVRARAEDEARNKARRLAKGRQHQYKNVYGKRVIWVFRELLDVVELYDPRMHEGAEGYYRFLNKGKLDLLRRILRRHGRWRVEHRKPRKEC